MLPARPGREGVHPRPRDTGIPRLLGPRDLTGPESRT